MSETKPLTMTLEKWDRLCKIVTTARPDTKSGAALLDTFKELHAVLAALAEAQREAKNANEVRAAIEKLAESQERKVRDELAARDRALAAAQLNARTLREALVRIHQAHYDAAYSHDAHKLAVYDCMAKWAHEAYASAPADEAALMEFGRKVVGETCYAITQRKLDPWGTRSEATDTTIVNAALGGKE